MYYALIGSMVFELCLFVPFIWRGRYILAPISLLFTAFSIGWLVSWRLNILSLFIVLLGTYRVLNLLRIFENRLHPSSIRHILLRASLVLIGLQIFITAIWYVFDQMVSSHTLWQLIALSDIAVAGAIFVFSIKNVIKLRFSWPEQHYSDRELPTITVAIPARNETNELASCLDAVVGSDYPKLEILVLDDCSQDRTSEVIKGYAQAGVRFLHGNEPDDSWLAKNQAYDQLAQAANGEFILFLGVDTQLGIKTIRSLVTLALAKNKQMISVMPLRGGTSFGQSFIQPMRYWWELALPRKLLNRPAVLSTCWLVKRSVVTGSGGFSAVSQSVIPEAYFAKRLIGANAYSFIRSSGDLVVKSNKGFRDQLERAMRLRYPELHKRLELAGLLTLLELRFLLSPFVLVLVSVLGWIPNITWLVAIASGLLIAAHLVILSAIAQPLTLSSLINFPVIVITEIILGNVSMLRYEFSTVDWKGRNICIPVMWRQVQPSLDRPSSE